MCSTSKGIILFMRIDYIKIYRNLCICDIVDHWKYVFVADLTKNVG